MGRTSRFILLLAATGAPGCMSILHPINRHPGPQPADMLPRACRDHVYIFLVHGVDPLDYANMAGLQKHCHSLGFNNVYYGQMYHASSFENRAREIRLHDPHARFVLMGFSAGANLVRDMANSLGQNGIDIDLVVYMGGNTIENVPESRPGNAAKVVHVLASGYVWKGYQIEGAENYKLEDTWHFGSPTHPHTIEVLTHELAVVAGRVPVIHDSAIPVSDAPTPRPVVRRVSSKRDEWDFLKPAMQLTPLEERPVAVYESR